MKLFAMCLLVSIVLAFKPVLAPRKLVADKTKSTVTYSMVHPMHKWDGVSHDVNAAMIYDEATKQIQNVAVAIRVATFDSQNQNRDSHMIEVLEGLKYPNVTFSSQDVKTNPDGSLTANGKLTFHNVTKPVSVKVTRRDVNGQMVMDGKFDLKLTDYGIERPSLLGLATEDQFSLAFSLAFK
ncbi:YceI family protein [Fibrella sp. HMF5335]|uniref:YceI family protein n=1 Tax=Fibrella rubiginis TaxID=2817060 RepID=A0A939GIP5_9BACT|nr:YceI family protein [Fibrella rubiginis]MBO0937157.1 YceI family protein [Fibrella rubiginis]